MFKGILTFSNDPRARLAELDLSDSEDCLGAHAFTPEAYRFFKQHERRLSWLQLPRVAWAEPCAMFRMLMYAPRNMQDLSSDDLGKLARSDARYGPTPPLPPLVDERRAWIDDADLPGLLNIWSFLKYRYFPTGYALLASLALYTAVFAAALRSKRFQDGTADLALIGLMATVACPIDFCVAICGDGRCGLIKHLFLANLLFDVATIAVLGVVSLAVLRRWAPR